MHAYTHTRTTSQVTSVPQGPHTFPLAQVDEGFHPLHAPEELLMLFYDQVPEPDDVRAMMLEEKGGSFGAIGSEAERFLYDYGSLYNTIEVALWAGTEPIESLRYHIRRIMEMNPYAAYKWKDKAKASKKSIRGKGERRDQGTSDSGGQWRNQEKHKHYLAKRAALHSGDYQISKELLEYDGQLDGEYVTMEELIEAVIIGQEKVGNTINLFPTGEWVIAGVEFITRRSDGVVISARIRLRRQGG